MTPSLPQELCTSIRSLSSMAALIVLMLLCIRECNPVPDPRQRELVLKQDMSQQVGGRVELTAAEQQLYLHLHQLKLKEMATSPFPTCQSLLQSEAHRAKKPCFQTATGNA